MPFCQNDNCGKKDLKKTQVEIDEETNKVVCLDCYTKKYGVRRTVPVSLARDHVGWGLHLTSDRGLQAEVHVGDVQIQVSASNDELKEILGS